MEQLTDLTIKTISGKFIRIADPRPEDILIEDIAHGLAFQYRYGGHSFSPITVAEHSIRVYARYPTISALLHDAAEAYLGDLKSPIKKLCPDYSRLEQSFMNVIALKFNLFNLTDPKIKQADIEEFNWEQQNIMNETECRFWAMRPHKAKKEFIQVFERIAR